MLSRDRWTNHQTTLVAGRRGGRKMKFRSLLFVAAAGLTTACASSTGGSVPKAEESSRDRITSVEIASTPGTSAYDLVFKLRPHWLRAGATGSIGGGTMTNQVTLVYLDGSRLGTLDALRSITATGIKSMEWIQASRAAIVLSDVGNDPIAGAISIKTR
jgi:hypothetical protein